MTASMSSSQRDVAAPDNRNDDDYDDDDDKGTGTRTRLI